MEIVGQLTGGIAHDFNNMLQAISGGLTLMERRIAQGRTAEATEFATAIRQSLDRAAGLTHRLLAFSRRQTLQPRTIEPDTLVRGIEELIRRTLGPAVTLTLRLRDGVWNARSDPNQLESALLNLAINARDAMPQGGTLTIASTDRHMTAETLTPHDQAEPGDYVEIRVTDTGVGMSADVLARAFEPFFTTKPIGTGTGLGLSQLYGFVRQSGGFVRLESAPAKGTTVRMFLPRDDGTTLAPPPTPPAPVGVPTVSAQGRTVLVVEDEEGVRQQIADTLHELGCTVLQAIDGPSGLRVVQSDAALDLLVTDVGLPGLNGRQLAEAARLDRPHLPVLMITGYAGAMPIDLTLPEGMQILVKPFQLAVLTERVSAMLAPLLPGAAACRAGSAPP
jgi:CheY-like chemotaxis protein